MSNDVRLLIRGFYDIQQLRIQAGNRLVNHFLNKLEKSDDKLKAKQLHQMLKQEYNRLTDGLIEVSDIYKIIKQNDGLISTTAEYALINYYFSLLSQEKEMIKQITHIIDGHILYEGYLKQVKGIGPVMAAVLISEIDLEKAIYVSSVWRYCGLDVININGEAIGRSKKRVCLQVVKYEENGEQKERKTIGYNPWLKGKIIGVLTKSLLIHNAEYKAIYDNYKHRLETHPKHKGKTKMHRHNMALRYTAKMFLKDYYLHGRALLGLPVNPPYQEAKLGHVHSK